MLKDLNEGSKKNKCHARRQPSYTNAPISLYIAQVSNSKCKVLFVLGHSWCNGTLPFVPELTGVSAERTVRGFLRDAHTVRCNAAARCSPSPYAGHFPSTEHTGRKRLEEPSGSCSEHLLLLRSDAKCGSADSVK